MTFNDKTDEFDSIKKVIWNDNGLSQHTLEVKAFLEFNKIDILLVSETDSTEKCHFNINAYKLNHTSHPDK